MKKILFLLLLTVASYGQTSTGQEQEFDYGIKNNASQTVINPNMLVTEGADGTYGKVSVNNVPISTAVRDSLNKKLNLPTGFLQGLQLSINADPTKFNIAPGYYVVTDFTNLANPVVKIITYPGATGLTPAYLATANSTYVALDINGNVVSSASPFTNADRRTLAIVGNVVHSNNTTVNVTNEIKAPIVASTNQVHDFMRAIGFLNEEGNIYSPNGANLQINKSAGKIFGMGINSADYLNPHQLSMPAQTALTFAYRLRGGTQYANTTSIDPNNWDNAGVLTSVPVGNRWTIQRINLFQSGLTRIQYGQTVYTSYNDAVTALPTQSFVTEQNIADNAVFRCYLIVQQGTTNLASAVAAGTALFVPVDKFGNVIGNGSVALTYANIVAALGYTPENVANKSDSYTASSSTTYASTKALVDGLATTIHTTGDETKTGKLNLQNLHMYSVDKPVFTTVTDTGVSGVLSGLYYYDVTYYTALGETEGSGEQSITVSSKQVSVTLPVSANASVIGRRIYRTIANPFDSVIKNLVVDIPNNTATSYVDNIADGSLGVALPRMNSTGSQLFNNTERIGFASKISTSFGLNSFLQNTGYANTAFGYGTLTDNSIGYRNTATGVFSMYKNTTGYNNTATGVHSLNDNTTGYDNTAVGYASLISNTTGISNTSLGATALNSNIIGSANTAIGARSLQLNTASNNTAIGFQSMQFSTTGTQNTAIGNESLKNNAGGNFNTALGFGAINSADGTGNTSVGWGSGQGTIVEDNSFFGKQAGGNAIGFRNTHVGNQSGFTGGGSDGVFLGNQAGFYETGNGKLFIDNVQRASESDARVKALIYGQFDALTANQFVNINGALNVSGVATAPTAAPGTNTTQIATTAFVQAAKAIAVRKISTNTTLSDSDNGKVILLTASCTVTLPNGLMSGFNCSFSTVGGAVLTYSLGGSVTLLRGAGTTMDELSDHTIVNTGVANEYLTVGL